jgi:N-acetylglutamate synthase-like GNAT family acetyltransferase
VVIEHLKSEEYPQLAAVADGYVPDPKTSVTLVVRDQNGIVGRVFLISPVHVEGPWVRQDLRGSMVAGKLMLEAENVAKRSGIRKMFAYGASEELEDYLERLGYKREPLTVWTKEI